MICNLHVEIHSFTYTHVHLLLSVSRETGMRMWYICRKGIRSCRFFELKWNKTADGAISQIKEKNYPQVFEAYGSDILLVGINYDAESKKHECMIE